MLGKLYCLRFYLSKIYTLFYISYNVNYQRAARITEPPRTYQDLYSLSCSIMSQPSQALLPKHEGRLQLALQAYQSGQYRSHQAVAPTYNVKRRILNERAHGVPFRLETRPNSQKLATTEEQTIVQYLLALDSRRVAPRLCEVAYMANKLLGVRSGKPVDKCWAERFVTRSAKLEVAFNRAKDRQRILQEDLAVIGAWFKLVEETKVKYSIHDDDVHNFDETGF